MTTNGKMIAMAVCSLLAAVGPSVAQAGATHEAKVKCQGINGCKGKGACATAKNSCAGQNACKGKGWIETTPKVCHAKHGTVLPDKPAGGAKPGSSTVKG